MLEHTSLMPATSVAARVLLPSASVARAPIIDHHSGVPWRPVWQTNPPRARGRLDIIVPGSPLCRPSWRPAIVAAIRTALACLAVIARHEPNDEATSMRKELG